MRFKAIELAQQRKPIKVAPIGSKISAYFACNVFDQKSMQEYLSEEAFLEVKTAISSSKKISRAISGQVAAGMKAWAMGKGATHYTHWFQPMNGLTAERHDSFFTLKNGLPMEEFKGNALAQQEPSAAGFPTGGLRSTFEARGYTAWDPSSPAFIREVGSGKTLCIPTIFVAYTGEALDYKSPLLKSQQYLEERAVAVCSFFDRSVTKVTAMLGCEQEYFLVDEALYKARPDLSMTKRTLFGNSSPKGQQLEEHYFSMIPDRIFGFMIDLEQECHKLGIPVRTRHNEEAPSQFEIVPEFEEVNVSVDHNQLLMDLMKRVGERHSLCAILHEKPFKGINGSAKHNNWSLFNDRGINLLAPGDTPRKNLQFLTFFINTIKAISDHADILRACVASAGNDLRLGQGSAPPSNISVYIGQKLRDVLDAIEKQGDEWLFNENMKQELKLSIHNKIPDLLLDNTDSNRTSPIAYTGDKFELRMVGASHNSASPMIVMNTIVGKQLEVFKHKVDLLMKKDSLKKDAAILRVLKQTIKGGKSILFEGDCYSEAWEKEMVKRKLHFATNTPQAIDVYQTKEAIRLFEKAGVLSNAELKARYDNLLGRYNIQISLEAEVLHQVCNNQILPAVFGYQSEVARNIALVKEAGGTAKTQKKILDQLNDKIDHLDDRLDSLSAFSKKTNSITNLRQKAEIYHASVLPIMGEVRVLVDQLELLVEDKRWPFPKFRELLLGF